MTKNKMSDLTDHLFAQMERLSKEGMSGDDLDAEVKRADAMVQVADKITGTADLQLKAAKLYAEYGQVVLPMLPKVGKADQ